MSSHKIQVAYGTSQGVVSTVGIERIKTGNLQLKTRHETAANLVCQTK
jgi:hypothetical protein